MKLIISLLKIALTGALLWAVLSGLSKLIRLAPDWPLWAVATVLAVLGWLLVWLYRYESRTVPPRRARWLLLLRLAALALLAWLLLEPTFVRHVTRKIERELVILFDESASMRLVDEDMTATRLEIARNALTGSGIEEQLSEQMRIRTLRVARTAASDEDTTAAGWDQATDLAAALSTVLDQVPPDQLAGALLVSDGRHNRPARVEDSARRFGILDAPVGVVAVGSPDPPRDIAVVSVQSPDAIHLGDKMRIVAEVKFTGLRGKQANVRLLRGEETIDERKVKIPEDHREELRFVHLPEEGGVGGFRIEIDPLEGERFADNNSWSFETSITEARTHVLLVDSHPRWEFRYLRNLFHGRDKSVQLQWVLSNPESLPGVELPDIAASAARPFGDSEANRLPETEEEWRKFDVIILGDIEPDFLHSGQWRILSRCINERGAMLVLIAGPRHMPHALPPGAARELVPADFDWNSRNYFTSAGEPFRFGLTAQGRRHTATRQAGGEMANEQLWESFPPIRWRHPLRSLREGADVLLTARREEEPDLVVDDSRALGEAIDALANRREREEKDALLVTRQTGRGKVALLLTDRTWRLREGAGDVHHHRFWGNLVRWGAGPLLRAGNERVALGTDHLSYTADDPVTMTARLRATDMSPVVDSSMQAEISRDGEVIATVPLSALKDSQGLHQTKSGPFREPGRYQIRLLSEKATSLVNGETLPDATFTVVASRGPIELADTTLNRPLLDEIATASGGRVVGPTGVADLASLFLGDERERDEVRETTLWDNAWIFILLAAVLTAEWLLRRNAGLP